MNDLVRPKLAEIVARHGKSVIDNPRRCEGILRDYIGANRREISVLTMALEEQVAADLLVVPAATPREVLFSRLARRLSDNLALSEDAAKWAVNSWAFALGVISADELNKTEQKTSAQSPQVIAPAIQQQTAQPKTIAEAPRTPQTSSPTEIIVAADGSGNYASINQAIRAAKSGGRIRVRPGLYEESVIVDKQIEIVGDGLIKNIIVRSLDSSCFAMRADGAIVRNLTLHCAANQTGKKAFAVDVSGSENVLQNCDVVSDSLACVAVHGATANVLIRDCRMRDSADSGVYFFDGASGTIEQCEIYQNKSANVVITQKANPTFKNCRIFAGGNAGFFVYQDGLGTIDDCDIYGHAASEVVVSLGGSPVLRNCKIHHSNGSGVLIQNKGTILLEECGVYQNADAGVSIGGSLGAISRCGINGNGTVAVRVKENSTIRVENSDLTGNGLATWDSEDGVFIENNNNREY